MRSKRQIAACKRNFAIFKIKGMLHQLQGIDSECSDFGVKGSINSISLHLKSLIRNINDTNYESWAT